MIPRKHFALLQRYLPDACPSRADGSASDLNLHAFDFILCVGNGFGKILGSKIVAAIIFQTFDYHRRPCSCAVTFQPIAHNGDAQRRQFQGNIKLEKARLDWRVTHRLKPAFCPARRRNHRSWSSQLISKLMIDIAVVGLVRTDCHDDIAQP